MTIIDIIIEAFPPGSRPSFYERAARWRSIVRQLGLSSDLENADPRLANAAVFCELCKPHELFLRTWTKAGLFREQSVLNVLKLMNCDGLRPVVKVSHDE